MRRFCVLSAALLPAWVVCREVTPGKERLILAAAELGPLHTVLSPSARLSHPHIIHHGHMTREEWQELLWSSRYLLGVGDPLAGEERV